MKHTIDLLFTAIGLNLKKSPPPPKVLGLRYTYRCNFNCRYCSTRLNADRYNREINCSDMSPQNVQMLLRDAWLLGCREVRFGKCGEPSVHPNFYQILSWAKDIGYSILFNSNGWMLNPKKMNMLDNKDLIRISIDNMHLDGSPNPQEYVKKLKTLFLESKEKKYKMIAVTHGAVNLELKSMLNDCAIAVINYPLLYEPLSPIPKRRRSLIRCFYPYHSISVEPDLKVNPCSCSFGPPVGQITDQITLKDIWYCDTMQNFRNRMYSKIPPEQCMTCDKWNRGIREWIRAYLRVTKPFR